MKVVVGGRICAQIGRKASLCWDERDGKEASKEGAAVAAGKTTTKEYQLPLTLIKWRLLIIQSQA
jgi:hypothetical protein